MFPNQQNRIVFLFTLIFFFTSALHFVHSLTLPLTASSNGSLPACRLDDYKYDFTECDSFGGRWRVSVPLAPGKCSSSSPGPVLSTPVRVNRCYSSCEGGQYFNTSSLLCQECSAGHYSLGGGVVFESFNESSNGQGGLPDGFNIRTESSFHSLEMDKLCSGWYVDPTNGQLVYSTTPETNGQQQTDSGNNDDTASMPPAMSCISTLTYTVKVVKSGRLRFEYRYRIPDDLSTLLFSFHYRLYANGGMFEGSDSGGFNRHFPLPTMEQSSFEANEVTFDRPGLYVFTWRSVFMDHPIKGLGRFDLAYNNEKSVSSTNNNNQVGSLFKDRLLPSSSGFIRIKSVLIEGIAYASECSSCPAGTFADRPGSRECTSCPANTAFEEVGAITCRLCDPITEYSPRGSLRCRKRPICGLNDFYAVPLDGSTCNQTAKQQKVIYRWIEPRICLDSKKVFPVNGEAFVNCTSASSSTSSTCDLGMDLQVDSDLSNTTSKLCQFCPEGSYRGDYASPSCSPCPPFTSPYYALSVFRWNSSLPSWSAALSDKKVVKKGNNNSNAEDEEYFAENNKYLNAYFSRLCIHTDDEVESGSEAQVEVSKRADSDSSSNSNSNSHVEECDSRNTWTPFSDHIRTGASSMLDSYLILSLAVPGFRSKAGGELSFVFQTFCDAGDSCALLFVETRADEGEMAELVSRQLKSKEVSAESWSGEKTLKTYSGQSRRKYLFLHSANTVKEWYQSTETSEGVGDGRLSFRHKVEGNVSVIFSWVFKRTTSFQSYAKIYSLLLTNSLAGSAVQCKSCPFASGSLTDTLSSNQCVTCPEGQYLEDNTAEKDNVNHSAAIPVVQSSPTESFHQCKQCPENYVVNRSLALAVGRKASCVPCGPGLSTTGSGNTHEDVCFNNCSVSFDNGNARYDLAELGGQMIFQGGKMFTAGGTQFLHLFKISLCGHPKTAPLSTCTNNITDMYGDSEGGKSSGVRAYVCRSTIIPDSPGVIYTTQSFSLGDELIAISREPLYDNISVHADFIQKKADKTGDSDYHLFFRTRSVTTGACPEGRRMTVTMRCSKGGADKDKNKDSSTPVISTPKSCPEGTCDGCTFHLMIQTSTSAACRLCRPFNSDDFDTVVGECVDGLQQVHYINPRGCVPLGPSKESSNVLTRQCTVLLPRHIQIAISVVVAFGLLLLLLVFHFWNRNRSLEYKYSKLIGEGGSGKGGEDDDDGDLSFDNCCAEMDVEEEEAQEVEKIKKLQQQKVQLEQQQQNNNNNRLDGKNSRLASSHEMQTLFGSPSIDKSGTKQSTGASIGNHFDEEGYETIHLTPASALEKSKKNSKSGNQIV